MNIRTTFDLKEKAIIRHLKKKKKATREKHKEVLKLQIKILDNIDKNLPFLNRNSDAERKIFQYKL